MLTDHARTLDPFGKAAEELIEALPLAEFNPHVSAITPPQGVILVRGIPAGPGTTLGQPRVIAGIAPATQQPRIAYGRRLDELGGRVYLFRSGEKR
jgi:hypothetical protein